MTMQDLTDEESDYIASEVDHCDNCHNPTRDSLQFNENYRGDLCHDCYVEYGDEEDDDE